jgi:hypothetical protein
MSKQLPNSTGAKGISDLPGDASVTITDNENTFQIVLMVPPGHYGIIKARKAPHGCLGAWEIKSANASKGWGPFIYDIAMEYVGKEGLMCDRTSVSTAAARVWEYYLNNRPDVRAVQLDYNREPFITPTDETDDCPGYTFMKHSGVALEKTEPESYGHFYPVSRFKKQQQVWRDHWATQKYIKVSGSPTIDELDFKNILVYK